MSALRLPERRAAGADAVPGEVLAHSIPVSVVVAARNEESNIAACVESVKWAAELIVADHGSSDKTVAIAEECGATTLRGDPECTIGALRNAAVSIASCDWVLVVDADERGDDDLASAIRAVIARPGYTAYRVPRRNYFFGREVRHGGWDRDRPVRLFRSTMRYNDSRVHEHVVTSSRVGLLGATLRHFPYSSLDEYFEKFDRYSRWWADDQWQRGRRVSVLSLLVKPQARFVSMYLLRLGILDGARGVVLAALASASVVAKYTRLWARQSGS